MNPTLGTTFAISTMFIAVPSAHQNVQLARHALGRQHPLHRADVERDRVRRDEMGFHWAKLLKSHGVEVLTFDQDRGEVSRKRGENAGVIVGGSMADLVVRTPN